MNRRLLRSAGLALSATSAFAAPSCTMNAMQRIELHPMQGSMAFAARSPIFPGSGFAMTVPETIGDAAEILLNFPGYKPQWTGPDAAGAIGYALANEKVRYEVRVVPFCDHVDAASANGGGL